MSCMLLDLYAGIHLCQAAARGLCDTLECNTARQRGWSQSSLTCQAPDVHHASAANHTGTDIFQTWLIKLSHDDGMLA